MKNFLNSNYAKSRKTTIAVMKTCAYTYKKLNYIASFLTSLGGIFSVILVPFAYGRSYTKQESFPSAYNTVLLNVITSVSDTCLRAYNYIF